MHPDIHLEQAQQASKEILTAMQRLMAQLTAAPRQTRKNWAKCSPPTQHPFSLPARQMRRSSAWLP